MKGFRKIQQQFESACGQLLVKRMEMADLTDRAERAFEVLQANIDHEVFGRLYFRRNFDDYRYERVYESRVQGSFNIQTGVRQLGLVSFSDTETPGLEIHRESGASITFSQSPSGDVLVTLHPFKSKLSSVLEEYIAIGHYSRPTKISDRRLMKLYQRFLRYAMYTSAQYPMSLRAYWYRLWLTYLDARNQKAPGMVKNSERILLLIATVGGFWVSFYNEH